MFSSTEQIRVKTDLEPSPLDEQRTSTDEEYCEDDVLDLTTLMPRQRIQINVHRESEIWAAELRSVARNLVHTSDHVDKFFQMAPSSELEKPLIQKVSTRFCQFSLLHQLNSSRRKLDTYQQIPLNAPHSF